MRFVFCHVRSTLILRTNTGSAGWQCSRLLLRREILGRIAWMRGRRVANLVWVARVGMYMTRLR
jgi:hypothetical protein